MCADGLGRGVGRAGVDGEREAGPAAEAAACALRPGLWSGSCSVDGRGGAAPASAVLAQSPTPDMLVWAVGGGGEEDESMREGEEG